MKGGSHAGEYPFLRLYGAGIYPLLVLGAPAVG